MAALAASMNWLTSSGLSHVVCQTMAHVPSASFRLTRRSPPQPAAALARGRSIGARGPCWVPGWPSASQTPMRSSPIVCCQDSTQPPPSRPASPSSATGIRPLGRDSLAGCRICSVDVRRGGPGAVDGVPAAALPEPVDEEPTLEEREAVLALEERRHGGQEAVVTGDDGVLHWTLVRGVGSRPVEHGRRAVALLEGDAGDGAVSLCQVAHARLAEAEVLVDRSAPELAGGHGLLRAVEAVDVGDDGQMPVLLEVGDREGLAVELVQEASEIAAGRQKTEALQGSLLVGDASRVVDEPRAPSEDGPLVGPARGVVGRAPERELAGRRDAGPGHVELAGHGGVA